MNKCFLITAIILSIINNSTILAQIPTSTPIPGDSNLDGFVDDHDLLLLERNWHSGVRPTQTPTITQTYTPSPTGTPTDSPTVTETETTTPTSLPTLIVELPGLTSTARPLLFLKIPAGSFEMGSPEDERNREDDEGPVHTVWIANDFYLGETEVTQAQWQAVMGSNQVSIGNIGSDYPVNDVNWNDINKADGFLSTLNNLGLGTFRLPSEAEWEYACRAGTTTRYSFGDNISCDDTCGSCSLADQYMWWCGNNTPYGTKPVHSKKPNAFGLYDMHGNVWEWCQDWGHDNYTGAPTDGSAWESGDGTDRMLRGGSCFNFAWHCRSAYRIYYTLDNCFSYIGLRLVWTP